MDRSFAARSPIARRSRPRHARERSRLAHDRRRGPIEPIARAGRIVTAPLAALWRRRVGRIALLALLIALPLLAAGWLALRDSPLASVERVTVSGLRGPQAGAIETALVDAAHHMSTLGVSTGTLQAAVAPFHLVRELRASPSFPHGLHITVVEQLPVAVLVAGATRTAVAADGVVLGPGLLSGSLPTVGAAADPEPGQRVGGASQLAALRVLGAAPAAIVTRVSTVFEGPRGLTAAMRNGLLVYFGDASMPHAKWLSLASVLANPSSAGASYVDVRLPSHPAAGFPGGVPPAGSAASDAAGESSGGSESTIGALAAGLTQGGAVGGSTAGTGAATGTSATPSEAPAVTPSETAAGSEPEASQTTAPTGG